MTKITCQCTHEWEDHVSKVEVKGMLSNTFYGACNKCGCLSLVAKVKETIW